MRRLVAGFVLAIAATAIAVPASAVQHGCFEEYRDGRTISVYCSDHGRPSSFQVVAHCRTSLTAWDEYGSIGRTNRKASEAVCPSGILGSSWVDGYHINWL
ncbi:hypothetical protein Lesp02_20450 [Lentzea sp. NBRC 105346]|uniref:hypothetical protein n=1 Tax=Lentzea sp. NBRC 105346 TaxID=3032205 RepID=UPI00249FBD3D|nr:hypothetical protein [Lentzea sp. NBRC 105346]GLZ29855.1 hypothetical protein Lesp02_20450 [Lentzea sp. NBRC 105346]